jgi:hypothetical protein
LQNIAQLQSLQHVALAYWSLQDALETAAVWQHVPQLRELSVRVTDGGDPAGILRGIETCSGLTKLELQVCPVRITDEIEDFVDSEEEEEEESYMRLPACGRLAGLTNLQDLCIASSSRLLDGDAIKLTALTGLTHLVLGGLGQGVGELAANALACSLKQLRHLDLQDCELGSMSCLAAIAHLPQLTELRLEGNPGLTRQGLMLLTGLRNLQKLGADADKFMTAYAWKRFWAAVRRQ